MSRQGTVRRIPSRSAEKEKHRFIPAQTTLGGNRKERRNKKNAEPTYFSYRFGWKSWTRNERYWNRIRKRRRIHNEMAKRSRRINRGLAS